MEFGWSEEDQAFRRRLQDFLARALPPDWTENFARHGPGSHVQMDFARTFNPAMGREGLLVRHWPKEHGGEDAGPWQHIILSEEMWSIGDPRSSGYMGTNWVGPAIMLAGTEGQKAFFLGRIARGEILWCQGFSEASAGSDLAALRTRAEPVDGGYLINGAKIWTSYAHSADYCFLLARTEGASRQGVTIFLVDMKSPGILVKEIDAIVGQGDIHEVFFTDVFVPETARLGPEGGGWPIVTAALHYERVGAARYEMARRSIVHAVELLKQKGKFTSETVQLKAAEALAKARAARLLAYVVIDRRNKDLPPSGDTSLARVAMVEADKAVGAFVSEYLPESHFDDRDGAVALAYRRSIACGLGAGSAEVQMNLIARDALHLPRE